jgi:hypothetical protein
VILAELTSGVAERLQQLGDRRVFCAQTDIGSQHPDLGQTGTDRVLARYERRTARCATLLTIVVGKGRPFVTNAIDVGGSITHLATVVVADVPPTDVVTPTGRECLVCPAEPSRSPLRTCPL